MFFVRLSVAAPAAVALLALVLPWCASGTQMRTAIAFAHAVQGSGVALSRLDEAGLDALYLTPLLAATSFAAALLGRVPLAAIAGALAGVVVLVAAAVTLAVAGPRSAAGPLFAIVASIAALCVSLLAFRKGLKIP